MICGDDFVPVPGARPMCAATVENGLVDFEQVETSALTGFPSQKALSEEKSLLRRKQSLLAYKFIAVRYDGEIRSRVQIPVF